jgi:hypothetical protein
MDISEFKIIFMDKTMKKILFLLVAILLSCSSFANTNKGRCDGCTIKWVGCTESSHATHNACHVVFNETMSTKADCASPDSNRMLINVHSSVGKKMFDLALEAKIRNLPVKAYGNGTCTQWPSKFEDILAIYLDEQK